MFSFIIHHLFVSPNPEFAIFGNICILKGMKKIINILSILFILVTTASAQPLQFELQPEAFPASINGWNLHSPWAGGNDKTTPELCDIDSDGDLDYFSGSITKNFWFFKNIVTSSQPSFQYISCNFESLVPICPGAAYSCIRFCDLNGDELTDVIISNGIPCVKINLGTPFQWDFSGPLDTLQDQNNMDVWGTYMQFVDIDSDSDYDLFTGFWDSQVHTLRFYENVGNVQNYDFHLITQSWQNIQMTGGHESPCFADLDSDGDLDLLVGTGQGKIYYYRNDGTPQVPQMVYVTNNFCNIDVQEDASPELADIDGDEDMDLFVGRSPDAANALMTQGDVYFYENVGTVQNYNFQFVTTNYLTFDNGKYAKPQLVDIDADGDPDLFSREGSEILLYRNQGDINNPQFIYDTNNFGNISVPSISPWFCDIDNDNDYDLFCGTSAIPGPPGLYLYINQGTPRTPNYLLYSTNLVPGVFNQSSVVIVPVTADIDADGDFDLFVSDDNGHLYYFKNTGSPSNFQFQYQTNNWQNIYNYAIHHFFCFYDIDNDGDLDLFFMGVLPTNEYALFFYRNVGTPQNADMVLETNDLFPDLNIAQAVPFVTDIDLDGDGDLFVGDTWGGIRFFRNMDNPYQAEISISISGNDVILHWNAIEGAEEYKIFYSDIPYFTPAGIPQSTILPPNTSWTDVNAINQGKRYYRVVVQY